MRCSQAQECVSARFDGELDSRRAAALERHLDRCAACRRYSDEIAAFPLDELEHGAADVFARADSVTGLSRLMARVAQAPQVRPAVLRRWWGPPIAAALGAAACVAGFVAGARVAAPASLPASVETVANRDDAIELLARQTVDLERPDEFLLAALIETEG
jgi:predicted anti-sigma-YlaC factor YlaD